MSRAAYVYPNDEVSNDTDPDPVHLRNIEPFQDEKDRLDIMHKLFEVRLEGKLHMAPIGEDPQRILDIGTGTGIWAMDIGTSRQSS